MYNRFIYSIQRTYTSSLNRLTALVLILTLPFILFAFNRYVAPETAPRVRQSLNENGWKFKREEVKGAEKTSFNDAGWLAVKIPHDFNGGSDGVNNDVFQGRFDFKNDVDKRLMYKGPGWYRTQFSVDDKYKGKRVFIDFEAVSLAATVWVNGKEVGGHKGGYTAFSVDVTEVIKFGKPNTLAVRADNTNDPTMAPWMKDEKKSFPFSFDYAIYGGIYRDVTLTITDPVKIERVLNTPVCGGQAPAVVSIDTRVKNYAKTPQDVTLVSTILDPSGKEISKLKTTKTIAVGQTLTFKQSESSLGEVSFWNPDKPALYSVKSAISYSGREADAYESVFGFRYFTLANNQPFMLNGENVLIRGINRHQDMQGVGYALPNSQHIADAKLIKDAGFNTVRHAHYPSDPAFTKACDELGLMLWLEIPVSGSTSDDPAFLENAKAQLTEMIEQHYNNPSVIVWGVGNEADRSGRNEAESNKLFAELVKLAKELDPNRPTTASNFRFKSNQDLVDVYSPQDWSGWYEGSMDAYAPTHLISEYGADIHYPNHSEEKFSASAKQGVGGKPALWSQEYGAFVHEFKTSVAESRKDKFPGQFVWLAFDFASPRVGRDINPIPFMNQKGLILQDHNTKKDAYYFYQSMYRKPQEYPMVYIVSHSWADRWKQPGQYDIWAYSNCDSVKLYNDYGKTLLGSRTKNAGPRGDTRFQWDKAPVNYNVLYAEGYVKGKVMARDTIVLKNLPTVLAK